MSTSDAERPSRSFVATAFSIAAMRRPVVRSTRCLKNSPQQTLRRCGVGGGLFQEQITAGTTRSFRHTASVTNAVEKCHIKTDTTTAPPAAREWTVMEMYEEIIRDLRDPSKPIDCNEAALAIETLNRIIYLLESDRDAERDLRLYAEEKIPRWIPVTDRLPEEWKSVLTYQPYVGDEDKPLIRVSWYIGNGSWRECERANKLELPVTHWMPLPEPPKEET